ncbi:MAG: LysR family transcriptional regulator ArgP [Rhizobiaceae bacterium]
MLDYAHLEALLAVEREKSFEGAARALGVTSSAISQRIKLLEERIGAVTLNRQTPVSPTEVGAELCRHAEMVLMLEGEVIQRNRDELGYSEEGFRKIKIAVNDDSLSSWFMGVLTANSAHANPYLLEVSIADQDYSIDQMKAGSALAAISIHKNPVQGFESTYLGTHVYRATASPGFMQRYFPDGVTVEALEQAPSLRYSSQDDLQIQWIEQVLGNKLYPPSHTIPSSHGFVSACLADVAWGMHPALMVDKLIAEGKLIELVTGETLNKPLYWHCSKVIAGPFKHFTKTVMEEATRLLDQSDRPTE